MKNELKAEETENKIILSSLGHTWILDLDGTIVKHNGYKLDGEDTLLDGAGEFVRSLPEDDLIIFITSRTAEYSEQTKGFLEKNGIRYDYIIFEAPLGERIIVNDRKTSGLPMSVAVNLDRNLFCLTLDIDESL